MSCGAAAAALWGALGLTGCTEPQKPGAALSFHADLGRAGAVLDTAQARATISAYRLNQGLGTLALDVALEAAAKRAADAMAKADKPASGEALKGQLRAAGVARPEANLSAGYRTLAEAFSGWRQSPAHDRVMRAPFATRMGIASAYAPASKYKVYWVLVVAGD